WSGPGLADAQTKICWLAAYLLFDRIQGADPREGLRCCRGSMNDMDVVKLAPCMCPARGFVDVFAVEMMKTGVGVGLQSALEGLQVDPRVLALAVFRVCEPDSWRSLVACGPVVANVGPEPACFGLPVAGCEHWHRCVIGLTVA